MAETVREIIASLDLGNWAPNEKATVPRIALHQLADAALQGERLRLRDAGDRPVLATAAQLTSIINRWLGEYSRLVPPALQALLDDPIFDEHFAADLGKHLALHYVVAERLKTVRSW